MGYGHIYVKSDQDPVIQTIRRHLEVKSFRPVPMTPEQHPRIMRVITEDRMRLYWVSSRIGEWTGIFEFRYYENHPRVRWGYTDGEMAVALSRDLKTTVYQMEVVDSAGFWYYNRYDSGVETATRAFQEKPFSPTQDPWRTELSDIIKREGIENIGLGYENIPGPNVCPVGPIPQKKEGIVGYEGFKHLAFEQRTEVSIQPSA